MNDILEQLREPAKLQRRLASNIRGEMMDGYNKHAERYEAAANEIEKLRRERDDLRDITQTIETRSGSQYAITGSAKFRNG